MLALALRTAVGPTRPACGHVPHVTIGAGGNPKEERNTDTVVAVKHSGSSLLTQEGSTSDFHTRQQHLHSSGIARAQLPKTAVVRAWRSAPTILRSKRPSRQVMDRDISQAGQLDEEVSARKARKLEKRRKRKLLESEGASEEALGEDLGVAVSKRRKKEATGHSIPSGRTLGNSASTQTGSGRSLWEHPVDGAAGADEQGAEISRPGKKQKKQKKRVMEGASDASALLGLARVGAREATALQPPLVKALYDEHGDVASLSEAEVSAWQAERGIAVENCTLRPITSFAQTGLPKLMLHATKTFASPSPIQAQCLPIALAGRDIVGIAATGSGKTLAFGLPCLRHIRAQPGGAEAASRQPRALILSPTRELAQQIASVMEEAGRQCGVATLCVYGGVPKPPQAKALRKGVDIVVATPGRLEDLMNDGSCDVGRASYLVLDEADRMLDLGFEPHIRAIAGRTRADRQTLMFSATWPSEVQKLAMDYLSDHARVIIGSQDLSASHSVTQVVEVIEPEERPRRLLELLKKYHGSRKDRVLVFVLYKKEASRVESKLKEAGWKASAVHGDISQAERTRAVERFRSGAVPLLVATDVAARGLDIPDVGAVINYSFPLTTEDYVHRIGRTGRAGKTGVAHTFFSGATDRARSGELISVLREAGQAVPPALLGFGVATKKKESKLYGAHFKEVDLSKKATKIVFDD